MTTAIPPHAIATQIRACPDCAIRRRGFLSRLRPAALADIQCVMERTTVSEGATISQRGEVPTGVYAIQDGLVKLVGPGPRRHPRIVDLLGSGDLVGLAGAFGRRSPFDAVAVTEVIACYAPLDAFVRLLESSAAVGMGLADHLSSVVDRGADRLRAMGTNTALERVASLIVDGGLPQLGSERVLLPLSRREVGALLGITPESVARALTRLSNEGLIRVVGREIVILEPSGLIARADR